MESELIQEYAPPPWGRLQAAFQREAARRGAEADGQITETAGAKQEAP